MDALNQFMFCNGNLTNASNREDASKAARELTKERGCDNVWLDTWMSFNDYDNPLCYRPYLPTKSGYMFVYQRVSTLEGMKYITPAHTIDELSQLIGILSVLPRKDRGRLNQPFRYHPDGLRSSNAVTFFELHETRVALTTCYRSIQHEMEAKLLAHTVDHELHKGCIPPTQVFDFHSKDVPTLLAEVAELRTEHNAIHSKLVEARNNLQPRIPNSDKHKLVLLEHACEKLNEYAEGRLLTNLTMVRDELKQDSGK